MSLDARKIDRLEKDLLWETTRAQYWAHGQNCRQTLCHLKKAIVIAEELIEETSVDKVMSLGNGH